MADDTKKSIKDAFLGLLAHRPLGKISVRSIVDECGVSRNTFYYHFKDIPNLLEKTVLEGADEMIRSYPDPKDIDKCIDAAYQFARSNKKAIFHIYRSIDRRTFEDYLMYMSNHTAHTHAELLLKDKDVDEKDRDALIKFLRRHCFGACVDWIRSDMEDESVVDEYRRMMKLMVDFVSQMK